MKEQEQEYQVNEPYLMVNGNRILVKDTEFVDISEDMFGRDLMTFNYKGHVYQSNIYIR